MTKEELELKEREARLREFQQVLELRQKQDEREEVARADEAEYRAFERAWREKVTALDDERMELFRREVAAMEQIAEALKAKP